MTQRTYGDLTYQDLTYEGAVTDSSSEENGERSGWVMDPEAFIGMVIRPLIR